MPEIAPSPPKEPSPRQAAEARTHTRVVVVDALRGLALALMALEHCSFYAKVNTLAEHYEGRATHLWGWPFWVTGLVTNMAAPAFWLVAGVSVALFEAARQRRRESEWAITRFFLIRAGALVVLDFTVIPILWGTALGKGYLYEFDVLTSMGVSLALFSILRRLPGGILAAMSLVLVVGYQWMLAAARPHFPDAEHGRFWASMWLEYTTLSTPAVRFPILGWCGLMGLGLLLGRHIDSPAVRRPRTWIAAAGVLFVIWLAIRWKGGYGCFVPYDPATPWQFFLVMSKGPPSLDFLTFNLGLAALAFAALALRTELLERVPLRWLVACGQASLCFYVAHQAVYPLIGALSAPLQRLGGLTRYPIIFLLGMVVLIPVTTAYRKLKKKHPESFLRYL